MYQRESYLQDITRFLSRLKYEVEFRNSINLYDINIHAEYFYRDFLNLVYGLKLENLNILEKNAANIDLIDTANKQAIQVTSQNDNGKIKGAIEGFFAFPQNSEYKLRVLLIAKSAKDYRTDFTGEGKYKFNHRKDVIDLERLLAEIRNKSTGELSVIAKFLAVEEIKFPQIPQISELPTIPRLIPANFPKPPAYFTGRRNVLEKIAESLQLYGKASLCGISGIGKSSVVYQYVKENVEYYQHVIFVRAARLEFDTNLEIVSQELFLTFDSTDNEDAKARKFCRKIQELCEKVENNKKVLLILDNVDEISKLRKFLPASDHLHILLTSNFSEINDLGNRVEIDSLSNKESVSLIYRRSKQKQEVNFNELLFGEKKSIVRIIRAFGFHPLAINISGAYIATKKINFSEYWRIFQEDDSKIFEDTDLSDDYQRKSIGKAFNIAFEAILNVKSITNDNVLEKRMTLDFLKLASVISPNSMPEELFKETLILTNKFYEKIILSLRNWTDFSERFYLYSFFNRNADNETFSTHDMVKRFLLFKLGDLYQDILKPLSDLLAQKFIDFDFNNKKEIEKYLYHVGFLLEYLRQGKNNEQSKLRLENNSTAELCDKYGRYFYEYGKYKKAREYYEIARKIYDGNNEVNQIKSAKNYNNLALLLFRIGEYKLSKKHFQRALKIREKEFGRNHLETAVTYNSLAILCKAMDKISLAEKYYLKALKVRENKLGKKHLDTATTYNNLALLYFQQSKYRDAKHYYLKALAIRKKELGKNHRDTASTYSNLALLCDKQKKYESSKKLCLKALEVRRNELGESHPDTATSYNNLGLLFARQEKFAEAKRLIEKAVIIWENVFGTDHSYTIIARRNLENVEKNLSLSKKIN